MSFVEDMTDTSFSRWSLSPADSVCVIYSCPSSWMLIRAVWNKLMHIMNGIQFCLLMLMYSLLCVGTFDADPALSLFNFMSCYVLHFVVLWTSVKRARVRLCRCRHVKGAGCNNVRRRPRRFRFVPLALPFFLCCGLSNAISFLLAAVCTNPTL